MLGYRSCVDEGDYRVELAGPELAGVAELYREAGFRRSLVDDVRFVRELGGVVFTATHRGTVVGVSSCLPFGSTGWIGGVAVASAHSRRGLGTRLTADAMAALHDRGVEVVLLHATAMAAPLYERMGFRPDAQYTELTGPALPARAPVSSVRPGSVEDIGQVLALDAEATGEDRAVLLRALWPGQSWVFSTAGTIRGFALRQPGADTAAVIAIDEQAGVELLEVALSTATDVRVPVPVEQEIVRSRLATLGYLEKLRTTRMWQGRPLLLRRERVFSAFNLYWG